MHQEIFTYLVSSQSALFVNFYHAIAGNRYMCNHIFTGLIHIHLNFSHIACLRFEMIFLLSLIWLLVGFLLVLQSVFYHVLQMKRYMHFISILYTTNQWRHLIYSIKCNMYEWKIHELMHINAENGDVSKILWIYIININSKHYQICIENYWKKVDYFHKLWIMW